MEQLNLKASHKAVQEYYKALKQYEVIGVAHEGAVKVAFQNLLAVCCKQFGWQLITEWRLERVNRRPAFVDGACIDEFNLVHGYWEAKDERDDLKKEVQKKFKEGYPRNNIIFQAPTRAICYQDGKSVVDADITTTEGLIDILERFFQYSPPAIEEWGKAVEQFKDRVPELGFAVLEIIRQEKRTNPKFQTAFIAFYEMCRDSLNPNLSEKAVEEMLIQHLLTERIFRKVFNNPDFTRRNVIAVEIEKVIAILTSKAFSREDFLNKLDHFYKAIEQTAATISDYSEKQSFLNVVYEKFFQGFAVKESDTHGIVYTPQPIVNFMVRSVEESLEREFGTSLSHRDVHILDPFVGTGNFVIRTMREIKKTVLQQKYEEEIHCNEVMLLPYYIASMNIEHEFLELTRKYEPFSGICLVDTFELAEGVQTKFSYMTAENTARVERQKRSPIFVIIGNPPYNAKQVNANDNNKNRKYKAMDKLIRDTYAKDSKASLVNKLNDPYIKAIRWASNRIGQEGILALVTNNSFIDDGPFDGIRKHLVREFDAIYLMDLGGNVWRNPQLSGTTNNVFGIKVGVSINLLIRRESKGPKLGRVYYSRLDEYLTKEQKYEFLDAVEHKYNIEWEELIPDKNHRWLKPVGSAAFDKFIPIGSREAKAAASINVETIFKTYSLGISTNRDAVVYDFDKDLLLERVEQFTEDYNAEVERYIKKHKPKQAIEDFVSYKKVTWSETLLNKLKAKHFAEFDPSRLRQVLYRTYSKKWLYYDPFLIDRPGLFTHIFPTLESQEENLAIGVCTHSQAPFSAQMVKLIPSLDLNGRPTQFFPLYVYSEDGTSRQQNITDWALRQFQKDYKTASITKADIFYYVYAVLNHPTYRKEYAALLRRHLPRIPLSTNFNTLSDAGKALSTLHAAFETQHSYPLEREETEEQLDWRVEKMRASPNKQSIIYNDFLTLKGIPEQAFEYKIGNRSALHWVIDQYRITTDKEGNTIEDPNTEDETYIISLIEKVVQISLESVKIIKALPPLKLT
jgi:predicted helicase